MHARSSTTKDLIRYLRQADQDKNVEAWSAQHPSVAAKITAGPFSASYDFVDSHRLKATRWMSERMRREGLALSVENAPVWLFLTKPPSKASGEWNGPLDFTVLKLSVPLGRLLVSFHYPWSKFLQFGEELFVYMTHEEKAAWNCLQPPREERLKSWDRMFDLSLVEKTDLSWGNRLGAESTRRDDDMLCLQATTATIGRHDVVEVFSDW